MDMRRQRRMIGEISPHAVSIHLFDYWRWRAVFESFRRISDRYQWLRHLSFPALPESQKCQENEEYVEDGSGCPNTCQSPKSEDTCTDVDIAGCQCKKGYVREGDKCVPYSECGCMMQGRYYPVSKPKVHRLSRKSGCIAIFLHKDTWVLTASYFWLQQGTSILSKNCNVKMSCKLVGGTPVAVKVGNSCGRGETCKSTKGIGSCRRKGNPLNLNSRGETSFWDHIPEHHILHNLNFQMAVCHNQHYVTNVSHVWTIL